MGTNLFDRPVNRFTTAVPLYIRIAEGLLGQIESGELSPGDRLPSERELSEALDVNRMTLRQALGLLETQGLLVRRRGDGTYVARPKIERQASRLVPFTRGMKRRGYVPGAKVITFERRRAEAALAQKLGLPVAAPVYFVRRLRLLNQEPMMLERLTMPAHRFPGLERFDLAKHSVYDVMETEYGIISRPQSSGSRNDNFQLETQALLDHFPQPKPPTCQWQKPVKHLTGPTLRNMEVGPFDGTP